MTGLQTLVGHVCYHISSLFSSYNKILITLFSQKMLFTYDSRIHFSLFGDQ